MPEERSATLLDELQWTDATDDGSGWRSFDLVGRGTTYACDRPGPTPDAPTVVLLHGWTATGSLNWARTIPALSERYRVIALDHRGHGRGIRSEDPFTLEDCADDAVALIDALGVTKAIFVGYSMGGPIAQLVWLRHRDRVSGLVLCATAADFTTIIDPWRLARALEEMHRATRIVPRSVRLQVARPLLGGLVPDPEMRSELLGAIGSHEERAILEAGREIRRFNSASWIGQVDVPVVVIVTERDRIIRPVLQRQLAALIPGACTIEIDSAHIEALTRPDRTVSAVVAACDHIALDRDTTTRRRLRLAERVKAALRRRRRRARPLGTERR
jgi:pimeloyl-ACP methyl ester carboxylesterase